MAPLSSVLPGCQHAKSSLPVKPCRRRFSWSTLFLQAVVLSAACLLSPRSRGGETASVIEEIASPDGRTVARVGWSADGTAPGRLYYQVLYRGRPVVLESRLGLQIAGGEMPDRGWRLQHVERSTHDETWKPVCGEQSVVRDRYRQLVLDLDEGSPAGHRLRLALTRVQRRNRLLLHDSRAAVAGPVHDRCGTDRVSFRCRSSLLCNVLGPGRVSSRHARPGAAQL